jgi:hypothetical protein
MAKKIGKKTADTITKIALKQLETSLEFKQPRMTQIARSEELYNNKVIKVLKGRFNIPIPVIGGFVDTLLSKLDDLPFINFNPGDEADIVKSKKVTASWEMDSGPTRGKWGAKDRMTKKLAIFSGRGINKIYSDFDPDRKPEYKNNLQIVDHYEFHCEPKGGAFLEDHLFLGQTGVYKSKWEIQQGAKNGTYDPGQVAKLVNATTDEDKKEVKKKYIEHKARFSSLGLDVEGSDYIGQKEFNLAEWGMVYNGKRYYLLFDPHTGVWIRCELLKTLFKSNLWPWVSWATHEDAFVFWSKAPCDDMQGVADFIQLMLNQAAENRENKNWGHKAYSSKMFPDPSQLEFRPGGLVVAKIRPGQSIRDGVYTFEVGDIGGTIDLVNFVESLFGRKTGVTKEIEGVSERDKKVGVHLADIQQAADRLGLYNKSYSEFWAELGLRYYHGLKEHLPEKLMVKMIGATKGIGWEELTKKDLNPTKDFDIVPKGGQAEVAANELARQRKETTLVDIEKTQRLSGLLSARWTLEERLRNAGYEQEEIAVAMDLENEDGQDVLAEAAQENQELYEGDEVEPNRKATTGHLQKHLDFSTDIANKIQKAESKKQKEKFNKIYISILEHLRAETPFAQENAYRNANKLLTMLKMPTKLGEKVPEVPEETRLESEKKEIPIQSEVKE